MQDIVNVNNLHCMKSIQIWSPNTGKYGPERTPYLDTFHAVLLWINQFIMMIGVLSDIHIKSRNWHKNGKNDIMPDTPIFF